MRGLNAFCPKSGAPLSTNSHYDQRGRKSRAVEADDASQRAGTVGELTNGARRSSRTALFRHFRRTHERYSDPDATLYRDATLALRRLKAAANGRQEWDDIVWFALHTRLSRKPHDVDWMLPHADLYCPRCGGRLRYVDYDVGDVFATCVVDCTGDRADRLDEIRTIVADLYAATYPDERTLDPTTLLVF
ncbi:hypothetical protein AUR64_02800 [Haloprofundus marisrubri]|uniref:Uncharacterized protein n=1 Tax=Haloprofundus marisrubri TaxID=1514971 RepID=A0A0W1R379_9EURY|nr:hypothetical protein [Haloprofundus marisrubri]KTG07783.1 hypothetical protein AUR64_02800 [Haloprofundus marisrubri]